MGLWRCENCGDGTPPNGGGPEWRWAGDRMQHKCSGLDPQAGHFDCRWFGNGNGHPGNYSRDSSAMMKELLRALPDMQGLRKQEEYPYGLWVFPTPEPGCPLIHRFPPPLHPIEWLAARSGFGGSELNQTTFTALAEIRALPLDSYAGFLGDVLDEESRTIIRYWHFLTPLSVPFPPEEQADAVKSAVSRLWAAAGHTWADWIEALCKNRDPAKMRKNFW